MGARKRWVHLGCLLLCCGCLPADGRPEPCSLLVQVRSSEHTRYGFATADGWHIQIDTAAVALGFVHLEEDEASADGCAEYAGTGYDRLFNAAKVDGTKVGLAYGLGRCRARYRAGSPRASTLLDESSAQDELAAMRTLGSDPVVAAAPVGMMVRGRAVQDRQVISFSWPFRRTFRVSQCAESDGALADGNQVAVPIQVRVEELFRDDVAGDAAFSFLQFAQADQSGDADGEVTLVELAAVETGDSNLLSELYESRLPRVTAVGSGGCAATAEWNFGASE